MDREKIKSIIRFKQEQPTKTLQQIGDYFGVSKPYIYKVLKQNNIPRTRVKMKQVGYCTVCYNLITPNPNQRYIRKTCVGKCTFDYYNKELKCAYCRRSFYRKRGQIINRYNNNYSSGAGTIFSDNKFMLCSQYCLYKAYKLGIYSGATQEFEKTIEEIFNEMGR